MVKFCTTCDAPGCGKRSEEYSGWPTCRACNLDICPDHAVPGSLKEHERDHGGGEDGVEEAIMTQDVYCLDCLATWGAEDAPEGKP